jgi:hypothetical protein
MKNILKTTTLIVLAACQPAEQSDDKSSLLRDDVRFVCLNPDEFQMTCTGVHTRDDGFEAVYCKANDTSQTQSIGFKLKDHLDTDLGLFGAGAGSRVLPNVIWVTDAAIEFAEPLEALYGNEQRATYDLILLTISDTERVFWDESCHPTF